MVKDCVSSFYPLVLVHEVKAVSLDMVQITKIRYQKVHASILSVRVNVKEVQSASFAIVQMMVGIVICFHPASALILSRRVDAIKVMTADLAMILMLERKGEIQCLIHISPAGFACQALI